MNNSIRVKDIIIFITLYLLQIFIFNSFEILNQYRIYPFIMIILFFPKKISFDLQLIFGFLISLSIDYIENGDWIIVIGAIILSYLKKYIYIFAEGREYLDDFSFSSKLNVFKFLFFGTYIFYFSIYLFDYYRLSLLHIVAYKAFINSIISVLILIIIYRLFFSSNFDRR